MPRGAAALNPDKKVQYGSTRDLQPLRSTAPAVDAHVGCTWVTETREAKERALQHSKELPLAVVLRDMGTDIYLQGRPTTPRNMWAIKVEI